MASTGEIASWIKTAKSGWARENDIIPIIREVVNILMKQETAQTLIIDPATGRLPTLATTDSTFGPYNGPASSWRVSNILLKEPTNDYQHLQNYDSLYTELPHVNTSERMEINGNWYYPFNFVHKKNLFIIYLFISIFKK